MTPAAARKETKSRGTLRRPRHKEATRAAILRAAGSEFLEHGYENFSLRRVAEGIGYSATTIYLYFKDKDELLLATVQDGFGLFDATIQNAAETPDPVERMCALGRTYIQFGLDHPALYRLMFMQRSDLYFMPRLLGSGTPDTEIQTPPQEPHHRVLSQELLVAAVQEAIATNQIALCDPILTADSLWAAIHGITALAISPLMPREHADQVSENLIQLLIRGLKTNS